MASAVVLGAVASFVTACCVEKPVIDINTLVAVQLLVSVTFSLLKRPEAYTGRACSKGKS